MTAKQIRQTTLLCTLVLLASCSKGKQIVTPDGGQVVRDGARKVDSAVQRDRSVTPSPDTRVVDARVTGRDLAKSPDSRVVDARVVSPDSTVPQPDSATTGGGTITGPGSRIPWKNGSWYLHGVNLPWYHWGSDFGGGSSGSGVSDPSVQTKLAAQSAFGGLKQKNVHMVRWWVFPDAWPIQRDASGKPTGLDPKVLQDMDAAMQLAVTHDLYYQFCLFNAPTGIPTSWVTNATHRQALADVLAQLFARYKGNPRLMTWEVFNESDWDIWNNKIALAPVQELVRAIANAVHANSTAYVTNSAAMLDGLPNWVGLGLDYYDAHWYDVMGGWDGAAQGWNAYARTYDDVKLEHKLDRPLIIGEIWTGVGAPPSPIDRLNNFYNKGYAGAYSWSIIGTLEPGNIGDGLTIDMTALGTFAQQHGDSLR